MQISLVFPVSGEHVILSSHVSSGSSYWTCLDLMTLIDLRSASQVTCRKSLNGGLSDVFLMIRLELGGLGEEGRRGKPPFWSHHVLTYIQSAWLMTVGAGFGHLAKAAFVRFLRCKLSFLPCSHCPLRGKCSHTNYSEFFCIGRFVSALYFNHLFVSVTTHGNLFFTLGSNPILSYFVTQIVLPLELFHLALWHTPVVFPYFLTQQDASGSSWILSARALLSVIFPWGLGSSHWRGVFGSTVWALTDCNRITGWGLVNRLLR